MINIKDIVVADEIYNVCPIFKGAALFASVKNTPYNPFLWQLIDEECANYKVQHCMNDIKQNRVIAATREVYKKLGKDPNRYRPSAEALCRRIVRDIPLYQIDTLVDLVNLVSIRTGYSIGGFDADTIKGDQLTLGVGYPNEPYEAIGRGMLNIEGLPVYRDALGGIGTPTSDHERTKLSVDTTHFLATINGYNGKEGLTEAAEYMKLLLSEYAFSNDVRIVYY